MFVLEFIVDVILFPFRKFPKTAIFLLVAIVGIGAPQVHQGLAHTWDTATTAVFGHPGIPNGLIHGKKK